MSQPPQMPSTPQPPQQAPDPQPSQPPKRSAWPTVIGVISIVLAALGIVCTPVSLGMQSVNPAQKQMLRHFPDWWPTWILASSVLGVGFGVLLLIAGILLLKRRPAGRTLHLLYAIASIVMGAVGGVLTALALGEALGDLPGPARAGAIGGLAGGTCGGAAYPIFLLVWFFRGKVRADVAAWE